eukprot:TRINITY_DN27894_c0_g1_i1.p1 TRINITY_DN27894_c0_g1~~TRINITY_DN27894_c0_g1_i1.p1  ORF type:complete len:355 (-),score=80.33 TRINITY_DN27894_c0_g1_i1:150-1214(-)
MITCWLRRLESWGMARKLAQLRMNWELHRSKAVLVARLNSQSIQMLHEMQLHSGEVALSQVARHIQRDAVRCVFRCWRDVALINATLVVKSEVHKQESRLVREDADLQMKRVRYSSGLRIVMHTLVRIAQLELYKAFRRWQIPVMEKAIEAVNKCKHECELWALSNDHRDQLQQAVEHMQRVRGACRLAWTVGNAVRTQKQRVMVLWAEMVQWHKRKILLETCQLMECELEQHKQDSLWGVHDMNQLRALEGLGQMLVCWQTCHLSRAAMAWSANCLGYQTQLRMVERKVSALKSMKITDALLGVSVLLRTWARARASQRLLEFRRNFLQHIKTSYDTLPVSYTHLTLPTKRIV